MPLQQFSILDSGPEQHPETSLSHSHLQSEDGFVHLKDAVSLADLINSGDIVEVTLSADEAEVPVPVCQVPEAQSTCDDVALDLLAETSTRGGNPVIDSTSSDLFVVTGRRDEEHSYCIQEATSTLECHRRKYTCTSCPFSTPHPSVIARHCSLHTGEKAHKCEVCGQTFRMRATLVNHLRTHTDERPYSCQMCPRTFRFHSSLQLHERSHTGERPYLCGVCDRAFKCLDTVKRHLRTHTGEKPYKCEFCGTTFADSNSKARHVRRKHTLS